MYYCNELKSLCVLSLYEGDFLGVVDKLYFDKNLKKLLEIELIGEDDVKLILPTKNIYHIGKNAITVKNNQAVNIKVDSGSFAPAPIHSKAYSINGEYLGIIKEISLTDKFVTDKISLDNGNILNINNLASLGKNTIIFYDDTKKIDIKKFTPLKNIKNKKPNKSETVEPLNNSSGAIPTEPPSSKTHNADFLIGRICAKDIFNFNNELLIKNNCKITKKNLKEIKRFGKLRELMIYCK